MNERKYTSTNTDRPKFLPGDRKMSQVVERMIRVDHAGEYGATRIYDGQIAIFGKKSKIGKIIQHMANQEQEHIETFEIHSPLSSIQLRNEEDIRKSEKILEYWRKNRD